MRATEAKGMDTDPIAALAMAATTSAPPVHSQGDILRLGEACTVVSRRAPDAALPRWLPTRQPAADLVDPPNWYLSE